MTLELSNVANLPITIYPGMKIGQISFMQMTEPATTPYGVVAIGSKYKGQKGPTPSRYFKNFEMTVLVTGATGFVGPHVVHALRARELPVRALVRDPQRATRLAAWGVELAQGDVTDPASLRAAFAGVDTVVHLVAIIKGSRADFERIMAQGTRNLVAAAQEAGVRRFVLASALGLDERSRRTPCRTSRAKWEMERAVEGVRARARDLPAELHLRQGRRRPADVRPPRALRAGDADRRPGHAAPAADLGRGRRGVLRARDRPARAPRTGRSSSAARMRRPGTSSGTG